jgi:hypothetical protein
MLGVTFVPSFGNKRPREALAQPRKAPSPVSAPALIAGAFAPLAPAWLPEALLFLIAALPLHCRPPVRVTSGVEQYGHRRIAYPHNKTGAS